MTAGKKKKSPATQWFQDAAGYEFLLHLHIVVPRFDRFKTSGTTLPGVFSDFDSCFCIHADSQSLRVRVRQSIHFPDIFEDCVRIRRFFLTFVFSTVRNR